MVDIVPADVRSRMMSGIRAKDTRPELVLRRALHARGFRYRLHDRTVSGTPDLLFPKHCAVLFVHGCFWHLHDCHLFKLPSTRTEFWSEKLARNRDHDISVVRELKEAGWRVGVVWECAFKGRTRLPVDTIANTCATWLKSGEDTLEVRGR
jgi:DNA mismatch endonuclease (patch repair protein)